jgi:hypothetical protein
LLLGTIASRGADAHTAAMGLLFWVGAVPLAGLGLLPWVLETRDQVLAD